MFTYPEQLMVHKKQTTTALDSTLACCYCGRSLGMATSVYWIAEGPVCTGCLAKMGVK